ncbi:uncharacterized protein B0H18DRAFT_1041273, partial [Fomitopsis serialis]|uniref:uncharacterized protein n=1 Tax=Fomitopsis serialis TaxID=139415 RepID=UPI002008DEA3
REEVLDYRTQHPEFKAQLPDVLRSLPDLHTLKLRRLGHEGFWHTFAPGPEFQFVAQNISVLHISEPYSALMKGALAAVSTIQALTELRIEVVLSSRSGDNGTLEGWDKTRIRTFARLRRLQIEANMGQSAVILDAIVAPNLKDVEVKRDPESDPCQYPFSLPEALEPLCNRNASSLRKVYLGLQYFYVPKWYPDRGIPPETEPIFLTLTKPLLQLHQLRELNIYIYPGEHRGPIDVPLPSMLAAWPMLETLIVEVAIFTPDALRAVVHACPQLKCLIGKCLSDDFLKLPAASDQLGGSRRAVSESTGHGLRQLRLFNATKVDDPADITKIAYFLDELFPRLRLELCVTQDTYVFRNQENWIPVLLEVVRISSRT